MGSTSGMSILQRNPEQMWNNYWADNYRHVCYLTQHNIKALQHSWYNIPKVQVLWRVCVCVGVCLCKTNHSILMCLTASLHKELAVTYSSGMDKTQEPISLVEGLNKDLSKLPAVWTTLQVIRASPTHSFSLSLRWPAHFPLHFYSFIGIRNCDIPFRLPGCWCCSTGRLPGAAATDGWSLRGRRCWGPQEEWLDVHPMRWKRLAGRGRRGVLQRWSTGVGLSAPALDLGPLHLK